MEGDAVGQITILLHKPYFVKGEGVKNPKNKPRGLWMTPRGGSRRVHPPPSFAGFQKKLSFPSKIPSVPAKPSESHAFLKTLNIRTVRF